MPFLVPKRNVLTETIDSAKEESLDKEVRYSTYKRKRTILFVVKMILLFLILRTIPLKDYVEVAIKESTILKDYVKVSSIKEFLWLRNLNGLLIAYSIAALICAPFKIAWTTRRLRAVGSSVPRWFGAWSFTIVARLLLFGIVPLGALTLAFFDVGPSIYGDLFFLDVIVAPWLTSRAYSTERVALRAPGARVKRNSNATESRP
ncbi:MAG: hypothetical protein J6X44_12590 [Thermoguttaceae bacterium]|nr:hypothetical protein [Thermoguttaceae bacterium]